MMFAAFLHSPYCFSIHVKSVVGALTRRGVDTYEVSRILDEVSRILYEVSCLFVFAFTVLGFVRRVP